MTVDLLVFGAHPDDVEIGAGGILAAHSVLGYSCGIVDLTAGEMASNGTVEERQLEAAEAAKILKCALRRCLHLPDAHLFVNSESLYEVIAALRSLRPRIVLAPFFRDDRHPDHSTCGELVRRAAYLSGLKRLPVDGDPFRPQKLYFYLLSTEQPPDIIVDVSAVHKQKEEAIRAHRTQFFHHSRDKAQTLVNDPFFLHYIRSRDSYFGSLIGVQWGEGLLVNERPAVSDLIKWSGE